MARSLASSESVSIPPSCVSGANSLSIAGRPRSRATSAQARPLTAWPCTLVSRPMSARGKRRKRCSPTARPSTPSPRNARRPTGWLRGGAQAARDEVHGLGDRLDVGRLLLGDADPVRVLELHHKLVKVERVGVEVLPHAGRLGDLIERDLELGREVLAHLLQDVGPVQRISHHTTFLSLSRMFPRVIPERSRSSAVRSTARSSTALAANRIALAI